MTTTERNAVWMLNRRNMGYEFIAAENEALNAIREGHKEIARDMLILLKGKETVTPDEVIIIREAFRKIYHNRI